MIPYKPYVRKKHVESILETFLTHENKNIQFEYYYPKQCTFSRPLIILFLQRTLKEQLPIFLINTLLLRIPLLALTDGRND
jgi:hypothetical protein